MTSTLLKRADNLISLAIILIGISLICIDLFTDLITIEFMFEFIILVLTLLAFTGLVERETRLNQIEDKLQNIVDPFLKRFDHDALKIKSYAVGANELLFVGASCFSLVRDYKSFLANWIENGNSIKFLIIDPKCNWLKHAKLPGTGTAGERFIAQINNALEEIKDLKSSPGVKVEVRLYDATPTHGICIVDGGEHLSNNSKIIGHLYLPYDDLERRPCFIIHKANNEEWFNIFYEQYYEKLWMTSKPYVI